MGVCPGFVGCLARMWLYKTWCVHYTGHQCLPYHPAINSLQQPSTAFNNLQQPSTLSVCTQRSTAFNSLQQPSTAINSLQQPSTMTTVTSNAQLEQLIELVRQFPVLYDPRNAAHKDAQRLFNTWSSIAEEMGDQRLGGEIQIYIHTRRYIFFKRF